MDDQLNALDDRIGHLTATVSRLEQRVQALEATAAGSVVSPAVRETGPAPTVTAATPELSNHSRPDLVTMLGLIGLLFIAVAGGYLLRATAESGTLGPITGVGIGLVYALGWVAVASRSAAARPWASSFHGLASALIGFPLVWEATTRFHVFTPSAAAAVLGLLALAPGAIAWWRRVPALAWIGTMAACVTSLLLIGSTAQVVPFAVLLIALGTGSLWMGYSLDWVGLRWPVAALANLVVSALTIRALSAQPLDSAGVTLAVQVLLVVSYLGSIGIRTLIKGRNVVPFEVVQTAAVLVVGFGGAVAVARSTGVSVGALGGLCLGMGGLSYATAFWFIGRRPHLIRNTYFYTSLAIIFVMAGCELLWPARAVAVIWTTLAVVACLTWTRTPNAFLVIHSALYLCATAILADAPGYGMQTLFGGTPAGWARPSRELAVLVAGAAITSWLAARATATVTPAVRASRAVIVLVLVWVAGSVLVGLTAPAVAGRPGGFVDAGVLATLRTSILSVAALAAAYVGRRQGFAEWGWLVYPLLVVIGLKMIAQDFSVSRPETLFVALALYGSALIIAPRARRSATAPHAG